MSRQLRCRYFSTASTNSHGGLELAGAYTWSHTIDTASYELGFQQTDPIQSGISIVKRSDYDVRHNLVVSGLWELPFLRHRKDWSDMLWADGRSAGC